MVGVEEFFGIVGLDVPEAPDPPVVIQGDRDGIPAWSLERSPGLDYLRIGLDLAESKSKGRVIEMVEKSSRPMGWATEIGTRGEFGKWYPLLDRCRTFWKSESSRLYLDYHPEAPVPLTAARSVAEGLIMRLDGLGIGSYSDPFVTRTDVAVDIRFASPAWGKAFLDAMESVRLPLPYSAWRFKETTVYHGQAEKKKRPQARNYCRGSKTGEHPKFVVIRAEREKSWQPKEMSLWEVTRPEVAKALWTEWYERCTPKAGLVQVIREGGALMTLAEVAKSGEIGFAALERVYTFLRLEKLGIAEDVYSPRAYRERRAEVRKLGLSQLVDDDRDDLEFQVGDLLAGVRDADAWGV